MNHSDELVGKAYDAKLMKRFFSYLKPYRLYVVIIIFLIITTTGISLLGLNLVAKALEYITDGKLAENEKVSFLIKFTAIYFLMQALKGILGYWQLYITNYVGQKVINDIRNQLYSHLQGLSMSFYDRNPVGRLVTRMTSDVENLAELFASGLIAFFVDIFLMLSICVMMFITDWRLALISLAILPALFAVTMIFRSKARQTYRDSRKQIAALNSYLQENVVGMAIVQIFRREKRNYDDFERLNHEMMVTNIKSLFYFALFFPSINLFFTISTALLIWQGAGSIMAGALTFPVFYLFWSYLQKFFQPIRDLGEKYNILQSAMASSERLFKLMDTPSDISGSAQGRIVDILRGDIKFRNVNFSYEKDNYVLKDVSFHVSPGESVAIVGLTGSGKTTITNLLLRFYDIQEGEILIDDIPIKDIDISSLRSKVGLILQDVHLFTGTVSENIKLGNSAITDETMESVIEYVNASEFISRLPGGFKSEVKERGATFSVGEKQLLSFARALAIDPKLLILDEATSSIDTETEQLIQQAMEKLIKGRTSIIIAHRLSTIKKADRIIVIHKGRMVEEGTHQELLAQNGIYTKLYELQYKMQNK
ncbi:MAG: ABC transporter ATP-binding protein [Planctomycetes bacterium]|nr:ABC transporter ATP-binding protein [Planctomycetota bacterium]